MEIGMRNLHVTVVILFLILLLFKTIALLMNQKALLDKIREKTQLVDIILGVLILGSGLYLLAITPTIQTYLMVKLVLVAIAVPLGIAGIKKRNKALSLLALLLFIYIYGVAQTRSLEFKPNKFELTTHKNVLDNKTITRDILQHNLDARMQDGKIIYKVLCVECHGEDGKESPIESADLTKSRLSEQQRVSIITEGKGDMRGYGGELSEDEIAMVSAYVETLKDKIQ